MSKLWSSFLEQVRILGNHSGCHQISERSFFINGKQLPVCARCTGVTIGEALAVILGIFRRIICIKVAVIMVFIMGFDWFIQFIHIKKSTNLRRLITGFVGGFGLFSIYIHIFISIVHYFKVSFFNKSI